MKHLDSTETRTKTVPSSRKWMSAFLSILGCLAFLTILFFIPILVYPAELLPELITKFSPTQALTFLSAGVAVLVVLFYIWHYQSTAKRKAEEEAQKIYLGIIAEKKIKKFRKKASYYLLLNHKKFKVKEEAFYSFKVGEPVEFRISSNEKGLFDVSKSTIFIPKAELNKERAEGVEKPESLERAGIAERVESEELDLVSLGA